MYNMFDDQPSQQASFCGGQPYNARAVLSGVCLKKVGSICSPNGESKTPGPRSRVQPSRARELSVKENKSPGPQFPFREGG